ncbi:hypothetical protein C8A05DRAFT_45410 [Staphylotrichum tortipilum]|uniref:Zn(2)-C6 fungal-type domain-containing protein n=1 Tax=Staphylotrichum tortipilum TaxID=2831512 RepID=A0AAN6RRZ3_9PEZI|nr:hypothetical protein C8A05DRAFT_45410 [Staphylotrichum longicolle]
MDERTPRRGRSGPRSRDGCWTCRAKKVKCDETRPICARCTRLDLVCDYEPRPIRAQPSDGLEPSALAEESVTMEAGAEKEDRGAGVDAQAYWMGSAALDLPLFQLAFPNVAANSVELTTDDHEAITHYRTSFSKLYHTKNPRYSLFSVMLIVAERSRIAMHMILALSGSEMDRKRSGRQDAVQISTQKSRALHHYSIALRLMADVVGQEHGQAAEPRGNSGIDLDCVLTALYLMLLYEQMFGSRQGLSHHLAGAAIIVQYHCAHLVAPWLLAPEGERQGPGDGGTRPLGRQQLAFSQTAQPGSEPQISQYSARLLARLALSDAAATSYGIGGEVISALYDAMGLHHVGNTPSLDSLETLNSLERYAGTLYRNVWGESYPPSELADDVESRPVFAFFGAVLQLRFLISQLSKTLLPDPAGNDPAAEAANAKCLAGVHATVQAVGARFADVLDAAAGLSLSSDGSCRLVTNLRFVVPHYHAVVLELRRLTALTRRVAGLAPDGTQREALQGIMGLAVQAFRHQGDEAMLRIAQPLFMVALETDDVLHREWVLDRFEGLGCFGARFERARAFLLTTIDRQQSLGRRVDVQEQFRREGGNPAIFVF